MTERVHHPPAFCAVHGIFPAMAIGLAPGAVRNSFIGCTTSCPDCGRRSEIIPGVYDALPDGLNVLVDASVSPDALRALQELTEKLRRNEISAAEAAQSAEAIRPGFGKLIMAAATIGMPALALVVALISLYLQYQERASSAEQNAAFLSALNAQTAVLEQIAEQSSGDGDMGPGAPGKAEATNGPAGAKPIENRRAEVNRGRRSALKAHREAFKRHRVPSSF